MNTATMSTGAKGLVRSVFSRAIMVRPLRKAINVLANRLSWAGKRRMHSAFGFAMPERQAGWKDDVWHVDVGEKTITVPLRHGDLRMDWACAMTLLGHDVTEKQTYVALAQSPQRPDLFLDVGGNFGTHSLVMLAHGISTVYFEPNTECHQYFAAACALNNYHPRVEKVALGSSSSSLPLRFPKGATWLGSIEATDQTFAEDQGMITIDVPMRTLDSYIDDLPSGKILLKIDVEGSEIAIFDGAQRLITQRKPILLFESWRGPERDRIAQILGDLDYDLMVHPWPQQVISPIEFAAHPEHNFVAVPRES